MTKWPHVVVTRRNRVPAVGTATRLAAPVKGDWEHRDAGGGWPWVLGERTTVLETGWSCRG